MESLFRAKLRRLRQQHHRTQVFMAEALGISQQYYHDLEQGRRLPSVRVVQHLCGYVRAKASERRRWFRLGAIAHGWTEL